MCPFLTVLHPTHSTPSPQRQQSRPNVQQKQGGSKKQQQKSRSIHSLLIGTILLLFPSSQHCTPSYPSKLEKGCHRFQVKNLQLAFCVSSKHLAVSLGSSATFPSCCFHSVVFPRSPSHTFSHVKDQPEGTQFALKTCCPFPPRVPFLAV